jgi:hypothetical protein
MGMMGCKTEYPLHCRITIVGLPDCMNDWKLWLAACVQYHKREVWAYCWLVKRTKFEI